MLLLDIEILLIYFKLQKAQAMKIAIEYDKKELVTELLKVGADVSGTLLISSKHVLNIIDDSF